MYVLGHPSCNQIACHSLPGTPVAARLDEVMGKWAGIAISQLLFMRGVADMHRGITSVPDIEADTSTYQWSYDGC